MRFGRRWNRTDGHLLRSITELEDRKREAEEKEALAVKMARQNTDDTISDAKRRYLERKKQKEEEAKAAAEGS